MSITPSQCRGARAMLSWSQDQLAEAAKMAKATIANFETGRRVPYDRTLAELRRTLEVVGAQFVDENGSGPGVRLQKLPFIVEEVSSTGIRVRHVATGRRYAFAIVNNGLAEGAVMDGDVPTSHLSEEARAWAGGIAQSLWFIR
jgi:transcriptional regulator with XRE-family HTH domain